MNILKYMDNAITNKGLFSRVELKMKGSREEEDCIAYMNKYYSRWERLKMRRWSSFHGDDSSAVMFYYIFALVLK